MEKTYLISDAAKQVQVETHVLRYWEEELGLPIKRNKLGHRYYTGSDVEFFKEVKKMKDTGLQLKAIRMYMKDGKIIPESIAVKETQIVPIHTEKVTGAVSEDALVVENTDDVSREEKSLRLQYLLKQFIKEAVQDSNQELYNQMRDTIMKELDYQFRTQEEREDKREENRIEREEKHFRQLDELLRKKNRRRRNKAQ
ncbi:MAG: MerR family transcriptional regulator [Lachnospiraceae bacterium]|nr:MerR family transcriptional regulator [Lachnospiraceae bacterium]